MIYSQLPPLNSVKAFDAVVRHGSISEASRILCVSQSAVSRHIAKLEDFMGTKLLIRGKLGTVVTKEGEAFFEQVSHSLNSILDVTTKLRAAQSGITVIKISSLSSFALKWLVPRLNVFRSAHPEIVLDVSVSDERPDFAQSQIDCAIISEADHSLIKNDDVLFDEELVVVAAPSLLNATTNDKLHSNILAAELVTQNDIRQFSLIHTSTRPEVWGMLFEQLGWDSKESSLGLSFQDFYISIAACVAGSGVAFVPSFLVRDELANGVLVQLLETRIASGKSYRLAVSKKRKNNASVLALQEWLIKETEEERCVTIS